MTDTPVPLAEQIAAVKRRANKPPGAISPVRDFYHEEVEERETVALQAALATLEQHERALADVAWLKKTNAEVAACYHDIRERYERAMAALKLLDCVLDFSDEDLTGVWVFYDLAEVKHAFAVARAALDAAQETDRE